MAGFDEAAVEQEEFLQLASILPPDFIFVQNHMPQPFEWIYIPEGIVEITKVGGHIKSQNAYSVHDFFITKYPITNAQYLLSLGREASQEMVNHPALLPDWFDAIEFCEWVRSEIDLPFALPTEYQWQRAAQGHWGYKYPWGDELDKSRFNSGVRGIEGTVPVTQYSDGASPDGVMDMIGNGREWTSTAWSTGLGGIDNVPRVIKGGESGNFFRDYARASSALASDRLIGYAFRLCIQGYDVVS